MSNDPDEKNALFTEIQRLDSVLFANNQVLSIIIDQLNNLLMQPKTEAVEAILCLMEMLYEHNQEALYNVA